MRRSLDADGLTNDACPYPYRSVFEARRPKAAAGAIGRTDALARDAATAPVTASDGADLSMEDVAGGPTDVPGISEPSGS